MCAGILESKRACLVLAPFTPSVMPSLGVSILKATLAKAGIETDVYYASLDFFRFFTPGLEPMEAFLEYQLLATYQDVGNLFFSEALWGRPNELIHSELDTIKGNPFVRMSKSGDWDVDLFVERFHGYADRVNDFIEFCYRQREWDQFDVVGFSSTFCQNIAALALARRIHERHPGAHIVFGGANCEGDMGRQILHSFPQVDAIIQGEADFSFPVYVNRLRRGESVEEIPGLLRRSESGLCVGADPLPVSRMDDIPCPDFSDYFAQLPEALASEPVRVTLPIETSRGCWWGAVKHCVFCGLNPTTMTFRSKSPDRAYEDFITLRDRHNLRDFCAVDNIIDHRYFKSLLPRLEGEGLNIFYETKSNLSEQDVQAFARAGVRSIQPGIEGLSTPILRLMEKGVQGYKNVELLKWCATHGVEPLWFVLYRFANEPPDAYNEMISAIPQIVHLPSPKSPNPVVVDRFSPYFSRRDAFGFKNVRPLRTAETYYSGLNAEELFRISYHFESDLPQGNDLPYQSELWRSVLDWRRRYASGAYFYQFPGDQTTLLIDTRGDHRRVFLLGGSAHRLHLFLRQAHTRAKIAEELANSNGWADFPMFTVRDILLQQLAVALDAVLIDGPSENDQLDDFLGTCTTHGILLQIDGRYLGLAVDCARREIAATFGLEEFLEREAEPTGVSELSRG
jgi:ribosomal peptide maturation radical SAM protein 1